MCLSDRQFGVFLRNGSIVFLIFATMVHNGNIILGVCVCVEACPNYLKQQVCYFLAISLKKLSDEVDFMQAGKHENLLPIDSRILMGMVKHSQSSQSSKFAMSLQYLKKQVKMNLSFCVQINFKVS